MKTILTASFIAAMLFTNPAIASNTNSYPEYPVSAKYKRAYEREKLWNHQQAAPTLPTTASTAKHCSQYPKKAEYHRIERRIGHNKHCK